MKQYHEMTREEFDRDHARGFINGGVLFPWCLLSWKEKVLRIFLFTFVVPPLVLGGFVLTVGVLGGIIEGIGTNRAELERCQRHAVTPYEYHQCR